MHIEKREAASNCVMYFVMHRIHREVCSMNIYMFAGAVTGLVVGLVIAAILLNLAKKNRKEKFTYDERQKAIRGEAYKIAFYVLVCYNAAYGLVDMVLEKPWAENLTGVMIGVCLAVTVHVVYSIWHECYFSMNEEPKRVLLLFGIISIINVVIAVGQGAHGKLIENGMLTNNCANLVVAIMFFCIMITLLVKWQVKKKEIDAEE